MSSGANPATRASHRANELSRPSGEYRGGGAWVEALCLFYDRDCMPQRAANIRAGAALDYLDIRTIEALKAAFGRMAA